MWKLKGYTVDAFDQTQVVYNIWANTRNDLPSTMTDVGYGTALGFGSTAQTFDDSKEWRWNGTQWVEQTDGSGGGGASSADQVSYDNTDSGLTATNVQDAIDELHDTDETQDNALVELYAENANQQLEINYAINTGSKNKLNLSLTTQTVNGVTFTVNDDQTISVNGTPTTSFGTTIVTVSGLLGEYTLTGCPSGGSGSTYRLYRAGASASESDIGNGYTYTFEPQNSHAIRIYLYTGNTFNNLTFKPMLRAAEIKSTTFEPYAPTNRELYETSQSSYDFIFGIGTALSSNDDLNNYNKVGKVYAATGAIATTISNTPWTLSGFMVITIPLLTTTTFMQFVLPSSMGGKWYRRRYTQGIWSAWIEYDGTQLATTQSVSPVSTLNLNRNELNEQLDSNFDLIDSIPEEEEGEEDD